MILLEAWRRQARVRLVQVTQAGEGATLFMIDSADDAAVAAVKVSATPICAEENTHSFAYEWACATGSCV
jgi:hypothetical protein